MSDQYWIWSHGFKIREPEKANPAYGRFTEEQLNAMSHNEQIDAFIAREKYDQDIVYFSNDRMEYIKAHGIGHERMVVEIPLPNGKLFRVQYTRVLMSSARAVEFKMRFFAFEVDNG